MLPSGAAPNEAAGCLYIKKLADVDQKVLETLVLESVAAKRARHPN
jgi:hypothetical protein